MNTTLYPEVPPQEFTVTSWQEHNGTALQAFAYGKNFCILYKGFDPLHDREFMEADFRRYIDQYRRSIVLGVEA